eukprot:626687-Pleurochrysis_carterae.AAC.4
MHSFPNCICIACALAERPRSASQALDSPLAHAAWPPPPASTPTQSRPVGLGALSLRACARFPTTGSWYHISKSISGLPRMFAQGRFRVTFMYAVHAN